MTELAELLPDEAYRFHLTLQRGDPRAFFAPSVAQAEILTERRRWIAETPGRYARLAPTAEPARAEFAQWLRASGLGEAATVEALGGAVEADVLFLTADAQGAYRLRGGALVFPTGWALEERMGLPLAEIHGVVPGLNAALGPAIDALLARLRPGNAVYRANWGLAATDALNAHPARGLSAPALPVALERLWLRVEHQVLLRLPLSAAIVFGIRISLHRLDQVAAEPRARLGLARALETMPADLAVYKRLDAVRGTVVDRLRDHDHA